MSLGLTIGIKKTFFPSCGIYGNQPHASLDPNYNRFLNSLTQKVANGGFLKDEEIQLIVANQLGKTISSKMIGNFANALEISSDVGTGISQYLNFWEIVKAIQKRTYRVVEKITELNDDQLHNHLHEATEESIQALKVRNSLVGVLDSLGLTLEIKRFLYHNDVKTLNAILEKHHINQPLEILLHEKEFRKILLKLHPDKGGNKEYFTTIMNIKEKFNEDLSVYKVVQPEIVYNTIWGLKFLDVIVDAIRFAHEPTSHHTQKMLTNSAYLYSITYGSNYHIIIINSLNMMHSLYQAEYSKAIEQTATLAIYAILPSLIKNIEIPYLESIYGISMVAFTGYTFLANLYSLYLEYGSVEVSVKSNAEYEDLAQTSDNNLFQQLYDFFKSVKEYKVQEVNPPVKITPNQLIQMQYESLQANYDLLLNQLFSNRYDIGEDDIEFSNNYS